MTLRLRDEDRRAVDLLLDRAASGPGNLPGAHAGNGNSNGHHSGHSTFAQVSADVQSRLPAVQNMLHLLDMMPAEEPPADLLDRTLRRVENEAAKHPSVLRGAQTSGLGTPMHQPHA